MDDKIFKDAEDIFKKAERAHDFSHSQRVFKLSLDLASEYTNINKTLLFAVCCFHDIGRAMPENNKNHALISAEWSLKNFSRYGFTNQEIQEAASAIETHSWSMRKTPENLMGIILQDADRLDSLGAIGLMRTFAFYKGRTLYDEADPFLESNRKPDENHYILDHIFVKLLKIPETLNTDKAKKIGLKRVNFMKLFLERLRREIPEANRTY